MSDVMWNNFVPLWNHLRELGDGTLLTGGYALFLKQEWLRQNIDVKTVVDIGSWVDSVPRATKDFDVIADIEVIANFNNNKKAAKVVADNGFEEVLPCWKFKKILDEGKKLVLELHAIPPLIKRNDVRVGTDRIKSMHKKPDGVSIIQWL